MKKQILWLHAGGSKTGSSALQNFFEKNADKLNEYDYLYENRLNIESDYQITSGNGWKLYEILHSEVATENDIDDVLKSYIGTCDNSICSSEGLAELNAKQLRKLAESSERLNIDLQVVFYIRNVIPFMISVYDQIIKRHGEWRSFDELIHSSFFFQHFAFLRFISGVLPKEKIHDRHYETAKSSLLRDFFSVIGIDESFQINQEEENMVVNRSLTNTEREVMRMVNKIMGERFSMEISDKMILENPLLKSEPLLIGDELALKIASLFEDEVRWVNEAFFDGVEVVSAAYSNGGKKTQEHSAGADNEAWKLALEWALEKVHTIKEQTTVQIINCLQEAEMANIPEVDPDFPDDFSPLEYMVLNPDIMEESISPIVHYIKYGMAERRPYRLSGIAQKNVQASKNLEEKVFNLEEENMRADDAISEWRRFRTGSARQLYRRAERLLEKTANKKSNSEN